MITHPWRARRGSPRNALFGHFGDTAMSSLRERKLALKRKRSPKAAKAASGGGGEDDEDDAMIAALERKLGGASSKKKKGSRDKLQKELAEDGFGDGFLDFLDRVDPSAAAGASADAADAGDADVEAEVEADVEVAAVDGDGTTLHYAPTDGQDLYGRPTGGGAAAAGGAWVPPSRRARLAASGAAAAAPADASLTSALRGALNRISDATAGAAARAIADAYAGHPAARVNASVVDGCVDACLHDRQFMGSTLIPPYAAAVAAAHFGGGRDLGSALLDALAPFLAAGLAAPSARAENAAALLASLCDAGLVAPSLPSSYARAALGRGRASLALAAVANCADAIRRADRSGARALPDAFVQAAPGGGDARERARLDELRLVVAPAARGSRRDDDAATTRSRLLRSAVGAVARASGSARAALELVWADLRDADDRGRWWKQGAAWEQRRAPREAAAARTEARGALAGLAKRLRLATPARRAALDAVANAADADDAAGRLAEARRARACDDADGAAVLVALCGAERAYNPFYGAAAAAARGACPKFGFSLKLALWDALRPDPRSGEALDAAARRGANVGKLLAALLGADLALHAAFRKLDAAALADARVRVLAAAALRAHLAGAAPAAFDASLAPLPRDAKKRAADALAALAADAALRAPPPGADAARYAARAKRLRRFLADPTRAG